MTSYQPIKLIRLLSICVLLLCHQLCYGQWGDIKQIIHKGDTLTSFDFYITSKEGVRKERAINIISNSKDNYRIANESIIEVPKNTSIKIVSANTNVLEIIAEEDEKIVLYEVTEYRELYRIIDENSTGRLIINTLQKIAGSVKTANIIDTEDGAAQGTQWEVSNKGQNLTFEHIEGKVALNYRTKYVMIDDVLNIDGKKSARSLYR